MRSVQFVVVVVLLALVSLVLAAEDFYKILGLDKSASDKDIKRAYRTLSKKFHPDKNPYVLLGSFFAVYRKGYANTRTEATKQHARNSSRSQKPTMFCPLRPRARSTTNTDMKG